MGDAEDRGTGREEPDDDKLPFTAHLEELRSRLIKCFAAVVIGFAACYSVSDRLFDAFVEPLVRSLPEGSHLAMIRVQEGFLAHLKVGILAAIIVSSPVIFYQAWKFVAPGLYPQEKRLVWPFVASATAFFLLGTSFAYWVVFPFGFQFLLGYATGGIQATISMEAYLDFATKLMVAFGVVFELPVVVFFLARMGVLTHRPLARNRGYALVIIAIVASVLTPPDPFTMTLMAIPLFVLFELSILVARLAAPPPEEPEEPEVAERGADGDGEG
ncbi:MAG: twin-arginine translocase subunit TatC [Deferrisomatales bacterium]|nr:twin-arginine translocase subunit TatC [Deferrisomatales bacterium]